jgi:ATP-dependent Clp protease ATP-binding subunit ClpA
VALQLDLLAKRLALKGFQLSWNEDVLRFIAKAGFDPDFGAGRSSVPSRI